MPQKTGFVSKVSAENKALIQEMAERYSYISDAFDADEKYLKVKNDVPYHSISYFFNKFKGKGGGNNKNNKINNQIIKPNRIEEGAILKVRSAAPQNLVNYCPSCGCCLAVVNQALNLDAQGKLD